MPVARTSFHGIEVLHHLDTDARVSQDVVEVVMAFTAPSAPAISGGRISQDVVEVLHCVTAPDARVSQHVIEILFSAAGPFEGGAVSGGAQSLSYPIAV